MHLLKALSCLLLLWQLDLSTSLDPSQEQGDEVYSGLSAEVGAGLACIH